MICLLAAAYPDGLGRRPFACDRNGRCRGDNPTAGAGAPMRRRAFITLIGGVAAWPLATRAQQPAMQTIGWLSLRSVETDTERANLRAFRQGLNQTGYVE